MSDIAEAIRKAERVYVCGNGGSASLSNHFVNDLVKMCHVKAYSLCANEALLTAYANDDDYANVFIDQLEVYAEPGDLVITISTSRKSKNILKILDMADMMQVDVMQFPIYGLEIKRTENSHMELAHSIVGELSIW